MRFELSIVCAAMSVLTAAANAAAPQQLELHEGDKVDFIVEEDGKVIVLPHTADVRKLKGMIPKPAKPVSLEDMEKAVQEEGGRL